MNNRRILSILDKVGIVLLLALAVLLRSNLSYRTAFVDEALRIYEGWCILTGLPTEIMTYHFGWPVFSTLPQGITGWYGGLEWSRGLNVVWGVLTVLIVMLTARRLYGKVAGFIAGGIFAVYGATIFTSTFATHDSLSTLWVSLAVYFWVRGLTGDSLYPYALGSFFMVLGALTKYSAVMVALTAIGYAVVLILIFFLRPLTPEEANAGMGVCRRNVAKLFVFSLPFLLLLVYGIVFRTQLSELWQTQLLSKQSAETSIRLDIVKEYIEMLWLPLLLGIFALSRRKYWKVQTGLLLVGVSVLPYHLLNKTDEAMFKHTGFMLLGLAPLAAGGIVLLAEVLGRKKASEMTKSIIAGALGLVIIVYMGLSGQNMVQSWRGFWADTTETMSYLQENLNQDDLVLMEGGMVGNFYLRVRGVPGHIPFEVVDTWWYADEQGSGMEAYRRAIAQKRFDFIVLDYTYTEEFGPQFLPLISEGYELKASFPAHIFGEYGKIDIFRRKDYPNRPPVPESEGAS